jgi:hypothetical protein
MARRGPLSAAKRKREADKREKRRLKQEKRAKRAEERAQVRDAAKADADGPAGSSPQESLEPGDDHPGVPEDTGTE